MPRTRSSRVTKLLEVLTKNWADPKSYRDYYINELLPSLMADPKCGSRAERLIMMQIRGTVSRDEWEHLGELVANLDRFKDTPEDKIRNLFSRRQYKEAIRLYESALPDIFNGVRNQHIMEFKKRLGRYIKVGYESAVGPDIEFDLERIADLMTEEEWKYVNKLYWDREIKLSLPWLEICLDRADYQGAEAWYRKIQKAFPREKFDEMVANAKIRQIEWKRREALERIQLFIKSQLQVFNYSSADAVYKSNPEAFSAEEYEELVREAKIKESTAKG